MMGYRLPGTLVGLSAAFTFATPADAQTWDGVIVGKVSGIDAANGNNLDFRVFLDGAPACGANTPGFAYMNHSYDNYQATAALLMTAWTTNRTVTLFTTKDAGGWCKIGYVSIKG
jgi:hypothetical protein